MKHVEKKHGFSNRKEIAELCMLVESLDHISLMLLVNNAEVLLAKERLEKEHSAWKQGGLVSNSDTAKDKMKEQKRKE